MNDPHRNGGAAAFADRRDCARDDAELLRRIGKGDEEAMVTFYREHGKVVHPEPFRFSVEFSDGRTVTHDRPYGRSSGRPHGDAELIEPILCSRGGGGTSHYQLMRWWVSPLPPSGPVEFICQLGTREIRGGIAGHSILDAAQRSFRVGSDDEGWQFR